MAEESLEVPSCPAHLRSGDNYQLSIRSVALALDLFLFGEQTADVLPLQRKRVDATLIREGRGATEGRGGEGTAARDVRGG